MDPGMMEGSLLLQGLWRAQDIIHTQRAIIRVSLWRSGELALEGRL